MTPLGKIHGEIERCTDAAELDETTKDLRDRLAGYRERRREVEAALSNFDPYDLRVRHKRRLHNDHAALSSKIATCLSAIAASTNKAANERRKSAREGVRTR